MSAESHRVHTRRNLLGLGLAGLIATGGALAIYNSGELNKLNQDFQRIPIVQALEQGQALEATITLSNQLELTPFLDNPLYGNISSFIAADGSKRFLASDKNGTHLAITSDTGGNETFVNAIKNNQLTTQNFPVVFGGPDSRITGVLQTDQKDLNHLYGLAYDKTNTSDSNDLLESGDGGINWTVKQANYIQNSNMTATAAGISGAGEVSAFYLNKGGQNTAYLSFVNEDRQPPQINLAMADPNNITSIKYWLGYKFDDPSKRDQLQPITEIPPDRVAFPELHLKGSSSLLYTGIK